MPITVNQLAMINLAPRGVKACCVPTTLKFLTGECYQDIVSVLGFHLAKFREGEGVQSTQFFGTSKVVFGHRFTEVYNVLRDHRISVSQARCKFSEGSYYVRVPRHAFALREGQIFDLSNTGIMTPVLNVWKVEKI